MVGSPNYVRFVYDGDGSDTGRRPGPPGSAQIEAVFNELLRRQGLASEPTAFDGRSDYGPFIAVGIPAGGLFTGAEGVKTAEQAAIYGGTAGVAYDPCYHQACDTINNLNTKALNEMSDAAAHATLTLAQVQDRLLRGRLAQGPARDKAKAKKFTTARAPLAALAASIRSRPSRATSGSSRCCSTNSSKSRRARSSWVPVANGRDRSRARLRRGSCAGVATACRSGIDTRRRRCAAYSNQRSIVCWAVTIRPAAERPQVVGLRLARQLGRAPPRRRCRAMPAQHAAVRIASRPK